MGGVIEISRDVLPDEAKVLNVKATKQMEMFETSPGTWEALSSASSQTVETVENTGPVGFVQSTVSVDKDENEGS